MHFGPEGGMCAHDVSYVVVFGTTPSQLAAALRVKVVLVAGFGPARSYEHQILSLRRLPIPPYQHKLKGVLLRQKISAFTSRTSTL